MSLALFVPCPAEADAVSDWNVNAARAALAACFEPPGSNDPAHESRMYAMMHVAIHDALNAIDRRFHPYVFTAQGPAGASREAAVASAARNVLVSVISELPFSPACVQAGIASVETHYSAALAALPNNAARTQGIQVGQSSAAAVNALRAGDGSDKPLADFEYPQGTEPGEFRFVPGFALAAGAAWADVTPFVLRQGSQFRPGPPHPIGSREYTADFNEIKAFGGDGVTTPSARTPDQTQLGLFWIEGSALTWNRIARNVSARRGLDLWENARLFALLNLAVADGYITHFETKFHYKFWRPVTAVHTADSDGNSDTVGDPTWTPLQQNYPTPEYDSGHSVAGGAASQVLREFFGIDTIAFTICSLTLPPGQRCTDPSPVVRSFASFSQAEQENATSRILVGLHFRNSVQTGIQHGRKIGNRAVNMFLRPAVVTAGDVNGNGVVDCADVGTV
ncbi:MAG TPA: vanadium-dependent haloperoxidase, partial [Bryobacteraceae bacterium]|nr:vanadium-dependent haloperoxidase [Bryobacteraceae bacterium]